MAETLSLNMPRISVIMPVFNGVEYLRDAVESVLNQTFHDFEFLIVDDASTDETPQILEEYASKDSRIRVIRNTENKGIIFSLNEALEDARGIYIARMDCDDICMPDRFQKQLSFMEENKAVGLLGSSAYIIDEKSVVTGVVKWPSSDKELRKILIKLCPFFHPSAMIRKKVLETAGNYDSQFKHAEDYELWLRISKFFKIANMEEPLIKYRVLRKDSIGSSNHRESKLSAAKAQWTAIKTGLYSPLYFCCVIKNLLISALPAGLLDLIANMYYRKIIIPIR